MKKIVICDFMSDFTFPNFSMWSAERRIWALAKTISEDPGFEVYITWPSWISKYVPNALYYPHRLTPDTVDDFFSLYGEMDYLFAWNEYFDKPDIIHWFKKVAKKLFSFQGNLYKYNGPLYDGKNIVLFCYCDEMIDLYKECKPYKSLTYHSGVDEEPILNETPDNYIVRIWRLDGDKAPHYAILSAKKLWIPLYIMWNPLYDKEYYTKNASLFSDPIVKQLWILTGQEKMNVLSHALCWIYTTWKDYIEASWGVLSEMLRSGLPIAWISWRKWTAVLEAVNEESLWKITLVNDMTDDEIVDTICKNVLYCLGLNRKKIFLEENKRYDPYFIFEEMIKKLWN